MFSEVSATSYNQMWLNSVSWQSRSRAFLVHLTQHSGIYSFPKTHKTPVCMTGKRGRMTGYQARDFSKRLGVAFWRSRVQEVWGSAPHALQSELTFFKEKSKDEKGKTFLLFIYLFFLINFFRKTGKPFQGLKDFLYVFARREKGLVCSFWELGGFHNIFQALRDRKSVV